MHSFQSYANMTPLANTKLIKHPIYLNLLPIANSKTKIWVQEIYFVDDLGSISSRVRKWDKEEKEANKGCVSEIVCHCCEFLGTQSCWETLGHSVEHTLKSYCNIYQFLQLLSEGCSQRVLMFYHFQPDMFTGSEQKGHWQLWRKLSSTVMQILSVRSKPVGTEVIKPEGCRQGTNGIYSAI